MAKHSTSIDPQTCGKVERFHQTLKRYLGKQAPAKTLVDLQLQLDAFGDYYNADRPHRARRGQTPLAAFGAAAQGPDRPPTWPPATSGSVRTG